ncbi:MAG: hypothetical protein AAF850_07810 [Pseudomonadota bacterium]
MFKTTFKLRTGLRVYDVRQRLERTTHMGDSAPDASSLALYVGQITDHTFNVWFAPVGDGVSISGDIEFKGSHHTELSVLVFANAKGFRTVIWSAIGAVLAAIIPVIVQMPNFDVIRELFEDESTRSVFYMALFLLLALFLFMGLISLNVLRNSVEEVANYAKKIFAALLEAEEIEQASIESSYKNKRRFKL